ncbi:MAG: GNAT family N-acetyltransferase [Actinophytocola sp.]|uniref:GNAT family N-acetyltransferase n=1 Tax=Actinophytocola sp. TaxID=1872138 RepID=UPI003C70A7B4
MSEQRRDLGRGMYGRAVPVRPAPGGRSPVRCPRGHDLAIATARSGYHHWYDLTEITCGACHALGDPLASWCLVDPGEQHDARSAPGSGLVLVRTPPAERGGVGQLALWVDGEAQADLDLAMCGPCRRAVIEHVRTDQPRRGYGRVLVAAALVRAPPSMYRWSTTPIADDPVARAFWSGISWPGTLGQPDYCTDMDRAAGRIQDW